MSVGSSRCEILRAEPRMSVLLDAELRSESAGTTCRLLDLSRGGACLELDSPISPGREVVLHCGAMQAKGVVVWLRGRRCGIRFERQIRATDLLVQMSQSRKSEVKQRPVRVSGGASFPSPSS